VYFLEDEETLRKIPAMLPFGSVKSPRISVEIDGKQATVLLDTGTEVSVRPAESDDV